MSKIEKLTAEQEKDLQVFYREMLDYGRSIKPVDHEKAENIITGFYKRMGYIKPQFMYFSSPKAIIDYNIDNLQFPLLLSTAIVDDLLKLKNKRFENESLKMMYM